MTEPALDRKIKHLSPEVDKEIREELQQLLRILRAVGYPEGVLDIMMRLALKLTGLMYQRRGLVPPSDNLFDRIEDAVKRKIMPPEIASYLHLIRTLSNKPHHDAEQVKLQVADAENVLGCFLRVLEWFYCEYLDGPQMKTIYTDFEEQPMSVYISYFAAPPVAKNFLDREGELTMLRQWLEDEAKTVGVLIGIGGQGKTYLAAKLAEECQRNSWQVRWMDLPKTVDQFLFSIAAEMQKSSDPYHSVVGDPNYQLDVRINNAVLFLEENKDRWLFVLDNFHKVGDGSDWQKLIAELDSRCRKTKVLLTARREPEFPLKLPTGAHELQDVPPLPKTFAQAYLEACGLKVSQDEAERIWEKCSGNCEAMKLFAQAARRRSVSRLLALPLPDWSTKTQEWCEQLLSDLGEAEREAGKRLALFDEPVEGDLLLHLGATQEGLDKLIDWRLAELLPDERYTLHDIVKEYWRGKTSEDEKVKWHRLAGEWLEGQARKMREGRPKKVEEWELSEQKLWVSFLRRAFWHFVSAREVKFALKVAEPITEFLYRWGEWSENLKLCEKAYELAKDWGDKAKIATWAHMLAMRRYDRGDYEEAERLYRESLEIKERLGDLTGKAITLHELGSLAQRRGNYEEAERLYRESLEISERLEDLAGKAATLHELGRLVQRQGNYEEAERLYRESLEIEERLGNLIGKAITLHQLARLRVEQQRYEDAEQFIEEGLKIAEELESKPLQADGLWALGQLRKAQGRKEEARELLQQALIIFEQIGDAQAEDVRKDLQSL